jgi:hypothetical protein
VSDTTPGRPRIVAAVIALVAGAILALVAVGTIAIAVFSSYWFSGEMPIVSQRVPFEPEGTQQIGEVMYGTLTFGSAEPLIAARAASTVADVLNQLFLFALAVLLIAIAGSLLARRPFTRVLRLGLVILGTLIIVSGAIAPQLDALASELAAQELGFPTIVIDSSGYEDKPEGEYAIVASTSWTYILARIDAGLTAIGVALVLLGVLIGDGIRLQRETEGLV